MDNDKKKKKVALVDNYGSDENKDENKNEGKEESKVEPNSKNVLLSVFWVKTLKNFKNVLLNLEQIVTLFQEEELEVLCYF